jgi:hypothetical protein
MRYFKDWNSTKDTKRRSFIEPSGIRPQQKRPHKAASFITSAIPEVFLQLMING